MFALIFHICPPNQTKSGVGKSQNVKVHECAAHVPGTAYMYY